jgi:hypothetical protein
VQAGVERVGVGKDHHAATAERRREIPLAGCVENFERTALAKLRKFALIQGVNLAAQSL